MPQMFQNKFFTFLFLTWIILAFTFVTYNLAKTFFEIKNWAGMTTLQKNQKIFGDPYNFVSFIDKKTSNDGRILIYAKGGITFPIDRYYLYPKLINTIKDEKTLSALIKEQEYKYVVTYNAEEKINGYKLIASYKSKETGDTGKLYKLWMK